MLPRAQRSEYFREQQQNRPLGVGSRLELGLGLGLGLELWLGLGLRLGLCVGMVGVVAAVCQPTKLSS